MTRYKAINYFPEYAPLESSEGDLIIHCSLCDKRATIFDFDDKNRSVRISSAQRSYVVGFHNIEELREKLAGGEYKDFHEFLVKDYDGLDYYCPKCNKVYCIDHYEVTPQFEPNSDWYDYSIGVCPLGHRRMVDD